MTAFIVRRLLQIFPTLFGVVLIVFIIMRVVPGDVAEAIAGVEATEEVVQGIREGLGLNDPLPVQFWSYISQLAHGDLGRSPVTRRPVASELAARIPASLELASSAIFIAVLTGVGLGTIAAIKQRSWVDNVASVVATSFMAIPYFWLGLMLLLFFAERYGIFPATGRGGLRHLILPAITLAAPSAAMLARMTRGAMLEVINQDYIRTARSKGLAEQVIILRHALPNALIPIITLIGLRVGFVMGSAVVVETIFAWPGLGRLMIMSIENRDFVMVQGTILLIASLFVFVNFVVDVLYTVVDPRVRYG